LSGSFCGGGGGFFIWLLFTVDKLNCVSVDDTVTLTLNFKVVGNQVNWTA